MKKTNIEIREVIEINNEGIDYFFPEGLKEAVEVAIRLNQPLLITGEPGTGKTILASKVAQILAEKTKNAKEEELKFAAKPLVFNTKTTSSSQDLFYTYDAIGHFQAANINKNGSSNPRLEDTALKNGSTKLKDFLKLQALGKAFVFANKKGKYDHCFTMPEDAKYNLSHVVLIDEVDKAPRDFSNDLLNEINEKEFEVREFGYEKVELGKGHKQRVLMIMTSNSEKNLPDAFLRRCVFYHIKFPNNEELIEIIEGHIGEGTLSETHLEKICGVFTELRKRAIRKAPATAELVALTKLIEADKLLEDETLKVEDIFKRNLTLLAKTSEDLKVFEDFLKEQNNTKN